MAQRLRLLLVIAAAAACAVPASADTIRLKNGNSFEGIVERKSDTEVVVNLDGTPVSFKTAEIASITTGPLSNPQGEESVSGGSKKGSVFDSVTKRIGQQRKAGRRRTASKTKLGSDKDSMPTFDPSKAWWWPTSPTGMKISEKLAELGGAGVPILAGALFVIIFHLVCIYGVAQKVGAAPAWFAFVPGLNLVLLCWIAGVPSWWLIPLFLAAGFNPTLALASNAVFFFGFVGPGVARALQKPWWIGPVFFLYPLALLPWAYFAFTTEKKRPKIELPPGFQLPK